jgi:glutaredoxin-related protein
MAGPVLYDSPSIPRCSEAMEYLEKYEHFLRSTTDVPEHVVQSLWNLKMYTATVFEKKSKTTHA